MLAHTTILCIHTNIHLANEFPALTHLIIGSKLRVAAGNTNLYMLWGWVKVKQPRGQISTNKTTSSSSKCQLARRLAPEEKWNKCTTLGTDEVYLCVEGATREESAVPTKSATRSDPLHATMIWPGLNLLTMAKPPLPSRLINNKFKQIKTNDDCTHLTNGRTIAAVLSVSHPSSSIYVPIICIMCWSSRMMMTTGV